VMENASKDFGAPVKSPVVRSRLRGMIERRTSRRSGQVAGTGEATSVFSPKIRRVLLKVPASVDGSQASASITVTVDRIAADAKQGGGRGTQL